MAAQRILIDTSILVDYFRKKDKSKTIFFKLASNYQIFTSAICYFELFTGVKEQDLVFINNLFKEIEILSFTKACAIKASDIYKYLRKDNKIIEFRDIFIGATAIENEMKLATLNRKHFLRIQELELWQEN